MRLPAVGPSHRRPPRELFCGGLLAAATAVAAYSGTPPAGASQPSYAPQPSTTATATATASGYAPGASGGSTPDYGPGDHRRAGPVPPSCGSTGRAQVAAASVAGGGRLSVSAPPGSLAPGAARVLLAESRRPTTPVLLATVTVARAGGVRATVTVPAATSFGVYLAVIEGADPARRAKALLAPVVVTGGRPHSGAPGASGSSAPPGIAGCLRVVRPTFPVDQDGGVVKDVAAGKASLVLDHGVLDVVRRGSASGRGGPRRAAWVFVAAGAVALTALVVRLGRGRPA